MERSKLQRFMWIILALVALFAITAFVVLDQSQFGQRPRGERQERIVKSPHYQDGEFKNLEETPTMTDSGGFFHSLYEFMFKNTPGLKPQDSIPTIKTDLMNIPTDSNVVVWLGHSSYYMQLEGKRILVDPVLRGNASPFSWMIKAFKGTNIYHPEDIPDLDFLLITHDHWDHLDYETVRKLAPRVKHFVCGLGVGADLEYWGIQPNKITELDWYEAFRPTTNFIIYATPARHFSGRGVTRNQTLWVSFVLETPRHKLFLGGDSGYGVHFKEIGARFGPFDLTVMEQGQYNRKWKYIHMMPDELVQALKDLRSTNVLPVHNSKFALAEHPWTEPLDKVIAISQKYHIRALTPRIGEILYIENKNQSFEAWWKK